MRNLRYRTHAVALGVVVVLFPAVTSANAPDGKAAGARDAAADNSSETKFFDESASDNVAASVDKLTAWFEPMIIIFIGVVVGFVALAMVSAMYGLYNQVEL